MTIQLATPNILGDIEKYLRRRARVLPHRSNWASDLADPCLRRLVYHRTCWQQQEKPGPYLEGIFETGRKLERVIINSLNKIGEEADPPWELAAHAAPLNDALLTEHQIGCAPDVFLKVFPDDDRPKFVGPVDVKTCDPNTYRTVNAPEDLDNKWYMRRYPAQVMIYELASNFEMGWLLMVNKTNLFDVKMLPIPLDYGYAESLLQKADAVNEHVAAKTLPGQINNPEECNRCTYRSYCCPSCATGGNLKVIDNAELEEILLRLDEMDETATEIGGLERRRDQILKICQGQDMLVGEHIIQWKKSEGTHPAKPPTPYVMWRKLITRIGASTDEFLRGVA